MGPIRAVISAFRGAFDFRGRSQRSAYWWFILFTTLVGGALEIVGSALGILAFNGHNILVLGFTALVIIPDAAVGVRRLHDTGRRGWFYLIWIIFAYGIYFIPVNDAALNFTFIDLWLIFVLVLGLITLFLLTRDSQKGPNRYGPNPKGEGNTDVFD